MSRSKHLAFFHFAAVIFSTTFTFAPYRQLVEKQSFNLLVTRFNALQQAEVSQLPQLLKSYPYSQLLHALCARGYQDLNLEGKEKWLQESAVYATDRSVLKWVMTTPRAETLEEQPEPAVEVKPATHMEGNSSKAAIDIQPATVTNTGAAPADGLYEQVAHDLEELTQSKKRFEAMVAQLESESHLPLQAGGAEENLIKELEQHAKKRVKIDAKHKEQSEIIEKFIKAQPAMPKPKAGPVASVDLTEKTSVLSKDVISETLVDLLIKQGKKDRAIEMLKKLIWKFPQKKAYFAARIQELK